jgi:hypothetical protein
LSTKAQRFIVVKRLSRKDSRMAIVLHWHVVSSHLTSAIEQFADRTSSGAVPGLLFVLGNAAGTNAATDAAAGFGNIFLKFDTTTDLTQRLTTTFEKTVGSAPNTQMLAVYVHKEFLTIARSRGGHVYLLRNGYLQHLTDSAFRDNVLVDIGQIDVEAGDRILLCNDALPEFLTQDQIRTILRSASNAKKAVQSIASKAGKSAALSAAVIDYRSDSRDVVQSAAATDAEAAPAVADGGATASKRLVPALATLAALVLIGVIAIPWLTNGRLNAVAADSPATATALVTQTQVPATQPPATLPPTATAPPAPTRVPSATPQPSPTAPVPATNTAEPVQAPTETALPAATETPLPAPTDVPTAVPTVRPRATRRPIRRATATPRPAPTRVAPTAAPPTAAPQPAAPTAQPPAPQPPQPQPPQPQPPQPQPPQPEPPQPAPCLPGATCP